MNMFKRSMAVLLVLCMMLGAVPFTAFAAQDEAVEDTAVVLSNEDDYARILHLDNGRKYFSAEWIKALINEAAAAGYNQFQLAFGNDGLRFLLDDMSLTVDGVDYDSDTVKAGIRAGNLAYNATVDYDPEVNELTEAEMDEIIAYADAKGIQIVPHMNMPGHMDAILDAIEYVGIADAHFTGYATSVRSMNLNNDAAVEFAQALLEKYVEYFADNGSNYFHIGADEFGNDAYYSGSMGFPNMGSALYTKFAQYVNDCAAIVKDAGMTPRAWNDGVSYTSYSDYFDTDIQITYWSSGWGGYNVSSASALRSDGHEMINTHGDYYFVLTDSGITNPSDKALNFDNTTFMGSTVADPVGSMFCIWSDKPGSATEQEVAAAVRLTLRKMAAAMQDTQNYSTEVVPGGFNEDGTINDSKVSELVTQTDKATGVTVTALDLTGLTVTETAAPAVDTAVEGKVVAWEMAPETENGAYKGSATISVPVPEGWTNVRGGVLASDNGEAVSEITGTLKDGVFTFKVPHFSTVYAYERDIIADEVINLDVGGTHTVTLPGDLTGETFTDTEGILNITAELKEGTGGNATLVKVNSLSDIVSGEKYVLQNVRSGNLLGETTGYASTWGTTCLVQVSNWETPPTETDYAWTITLTGGNYYLQNDNGQYMTIGNNTSNLTTYPEDGITIEDYGDGTFAIGRSAGYNYTYYLNDMGGYGQFAGGYYVFNDSGAPWRLYRIEEGTTTNTEITFEGEASGTTYVTVGDTVYKIIVTGIVPITIKYVDENGALIKTETVNVAENATTYAVFNFTHTNGKFYVVGQDTIAITPETQTEYTVTVTETDEDLSRVEALVVEYWQTNGRVSAPEVDSEDRMSVSAATAYSENGVDLQNLIPKKGFKGSTPVNYWRSRLLPLDTNEQTGVDGNDQTLNGIGFTKVRYWNGVWAVYTEDGEWTAVNGDEYQLVAYYMNDMNLANEVSVGTSDWGRKGNDTENEQYLGRDHVSIAFQVVYEDGLTTVPGGTTAADLAGNTYFVDNWGSRGVGTIALNQVGDYQIWKVTAETGTHSTTYSSYNGTVGVVNLSYDSVTWDSNEMTVWEDDQNPVSHYTILNPAGAPSTEGAYANLTWDETNEAILIRIYIKAVETEDSLKIVYYDEKFGATLSEINVIVPSESNFNDDIVKVSSGETGVKMPAFEGNSARVDASGYGIVNALEETQNFETVLANVAVTNNRYNPDLYKYTGSVVSADGKTLTHYYSIDQTALSPNLVADFGLPLTFPLSQVVGQGQGVMVADVTVKEKTSYGTLTYNEETEIFTYTPTAIMKGIDVLTINILFDGQTSATTTNVGVTPATTVYYEETFLTYDSKWTVPNAPTMTQQTEVLGNSTPYGYDPAYATNTNSVGSNGTKAVSKANGATATFTFKGTGFELYANSNGSTGYVSVYSKGTLSKMYSINTKLQADQGSAFAGLSGTHYSLPIISETGLPYGEYTVQVKQSRGDDPIQIDGVRIINTINDSSVYVADLEDNPEFHELRDYALNAIGVESLKQSDYVKDTNNERDSRIAAVKDMAGQVYNSNQDKNSVAVIINDGTAYEDDQIRDLLDNGPKNELYLYPGQTLVFKVNTARVVQLGLKAPTGSAKFTLKVDEKTLDLNSLSTTVDMYYKLAEKGGTTHTVSITVSEGLLSVTKVKICDDPGAGITGLTQADLENVLLDLYGLDEKPSKPAYTRPTWGGDWSAWLEQQFDQWKDYVSGRFGKR